VKHVPRDARFYGMHLLSRLPLRSSRVVFGFESETPSIVTGVQLASGAVVRLQGLHPYPPQLFGRGTTLRDAELYRAAMDAAASARPSIIAGDLNATPWETALHRTLRLGGLIEPRVGRGLVPTFGAESLGGSWPLDYVLVQDFIGVQQFGRLPSLGSDHRPVLADLCLDPELTARQEALPATPADGRKAEATFAAARQLR
jgi:endonuclease/exonuclease/phosphatase (EEP) superfamily protein YafD